jgi:hypothetical protein
VSSIFTAIVERFGTGPMPVNQFLCGAFGFGFGFGAGDFELVVGVGVVIGTGVVVDCEPLLPVHAALASIVLAMITAVTVERVCLIADPLPVRGLG